MSQSSHSVGNVSAPAFRSAMNDSLQALASLNSGPSAPSTTYANMLWYDTAANILYMRSEADDAWIALGTLNQSTNTFTPAGSLTLASQAEAEAGTDNAKVMTPLRVRNALNATGSAPVFACRAFVNFNGTNTVAIRAAGNVSSITDNGAGTYTVNFATAMPDANYVISGTARVAGNAGTLTPLDDVVARSTTSCFVASLNQSGNGQDALQVNVAIFR